NQDFRLRKMNGDVVAVNAHVRRLDLSQVNSGNDLTMYHKQQAIAHEELREVRIVVFARNDFFHRVANGFEAMELLNLSYNCGLTDRHDRGTGENHSRRRPKADAQPYH